MYEVQHAATPAPRLLRLPAVTAKIGLGPTKLYELIKQGEFKPIKAGRATLFLESEVDAWIEARIAERDAAQAGAL